MNKLILFRDKKKSFRWHLKARNGNIIAESGESYLRKNTMLRVLKTSVFQGYTWYDDKAIIWCAAHSECEMEIVDETVKKSKK